MSYCVNCGVELGSGAKKCPLCGTPAWQPPGATPGAPYFPTRPAVVEPASKGALALLLSSMLASAALLTGVLNLFLRADRPWSFYVIGAAVMLWIWFVLPMVLRRLPVFFNLVLDVAAIGLYIYLISIDLNGQEWFLGLALPLIGAACVVVFLLSFLLRGGRRSTLSSISLCVAAAGVFALCAEYFIDRYFEGGWQPGWSLVVAIVCAALIVPLQITRHVPALREEARRRLDF